MRWPYPKAERDKKIKYLPLAMKRPLLEFTEKGIYCSRADVFLDPWKPVKKALISHSHSDHARPGSTEYLTFNGNIPILKHRLGAIQVQGLEWGQELSINGVKFSFYPAGHVPGSSQIRVAYRNEIWVFSGDYKVEYDGLSTAFEPVPCHTFITECTFGLPAFAWRPQTEVMDDIIAWWTQNKAQGKTSVLMAYSLGKAQRILHGLNGATGIVYTHGAIENMTSIIRNCAVLPPTRQITKETTRSELEGQLVLTTPSTHGTSWMRKMVPYETAVASGWMALRGARRRRAVDKGFVISDHADWTGLLNTVKDTGAERVYCTHGYTDIFARYLREQGLNSIAVQTRYEGESPDPDNDKNAAIEP